MDTLWWILQNNSICIISKGTVGTGFLWDPDEQDDYFFLFTAKHCIYGKQLNNGAEVSDITLQFESGELMPLRPASAQICKANEHDIAIVALSKKGWDKYPKPMPLEIKSLQGLGWRQECIFRGWSDEKGVYKAHNTSGRLSDKMLGRPEFKIDAIKDLDSTNYAAEDVLQGRSGSGLLIADGNQNVFLIGILLEYDPKQKELLCFKLNNFNRYIDGINQFLNRLSKDSIIQKYEKEFDSLHRYFRLNLATLEDCTDMINLLQRIKELKIFDATTKDYYYFLEQTDDLIKAIGLFQCPNPESSKKRRSQEILDKMRNWNILITELKNSEL